MLASDVAARIPAACGIGLRAPHFRELLERRPKVGWIEVHSEHFFSEGGPPLDYLERMRSHYPLSLHGAGMSLGSTDPLGMAHLRKLKELIQRFQPGFVSDHLAWNSVDGRYFNELLPLPYTEEALEHVCRRVLKAQEMLGCRILVENPSSYLQYVESAMPEWEFLTQLARRTGCGILLDVTNVYVSACNQCFDAQRFIDSIPGRYVAEIHVGGFTRHHSEPGEVLIGSHSRPVAAEVWALFARAIERFGPRPSLVEFDCHLPPLPLLVAEAGYAHALLERAATRAA